MDSHQICPHCRHGFMSSAKTGLIVCKGCSQPYHAEQNLALREGMRATYHPRAAQPSQASTSGAQHMSYQSYAQANQYQSSQPRSQHMGPTNSYLPSTWMNQQQHMTPSVSYQPPYTSQSRAQFASPTNSHLQPKAMNQPQNMTPSVSYRPQNSLHSQSRYTSPLVSYSRPTAMDEQQRMGPSIPYPPQHTPQQGVARHWAGQPPSLRMPSQPPSRPMTPQVSQSTVQSQAFMRNIAPSVRPAHLTIGANVQSQQSPLFSSRGIPLSSSGQTHGSTDAPHVGSGMFPFLARRPTPTEPELDEYEIFGDIVKRRYSPSADRRKDEEAKRARIEQSQKTAQKNQEEKKKRRRSRPNKTDSQAPKVESQSATPGLHGVNGSKVIKPKVDPKPNPKLKASLEGQQNREKPPSGSDDGADGGSMPSQPRPPPQAQGNLQRPPRFAGNPWRTVMVPASRPERRAPSSDDQPNGQDGEIAGTHIPRDPPDPRRPPRSEAQQASDRGHLCRERPRTSPQEGRVADTSDSRDPRDYRRPPPPASRSPPSRSAHPDAEHGD